MKQNDYWERFLVSGSVADYLRFRAESVNDTKGTVLRAECVARDACDEKRRTGDQNQHLNDTVREHAGFSDGYRNDFKIDSGR